MMVKDDRPRRWVQIDLPVDLIEQIDDLAKRELISRSAWLRREALLAVRASRHDEAAA
jgi:metal-responsive CopG/Arc/MetJ family transcriptional regulator